MKKIILCFLLLIICAGCKEDKIGNVRIMTVSDLHYYDPSLHDDGELFKAVLEVDDGTITEYTDEILEALINRAIEEKPDVLVLTGDNTFNGEYVGHLALAEKLKAVEEAGIPVLVLSGNHDIMSKAMKIFGSEWEYVETVGSALFAEIYHDYGYDEAFSKDPNSNSFIYAVNDGLRLICLDANWDLKCSVSDKTVEWLKSELEKAKNSNVKMISFSHQNLVKQSEAFDFGYVINNPDRINKLYKQYGVPVNFSGHMHIQHVSSNEYITEVLTESLALYQNHYGIIEVNKDGINYSTKSLDMPAYYAAKNTDDNNLLDFDNYSYNRFMNTNSKKAAGNFEDEDLLYFLGTLNLQYFTGDLDEVKVPDEYKDVDSYYLNRIMEEVGNNYNKLTLKWE